MAAAVFFLAACAPMVVLPDGRETRANSDAFRDYAEAVFRRHNTAAVAIIDALDAAETGEAIAALEEADSRMLQACEPLNVLAIARRDGRDVSSRQLRAIVDAVPACDEATRRAEALIAKS